MKLKTSDGYVKCSELANAMISWVIPTIRDFQSFFFKFKILL